MKIFYFLFLDYDFYDFRLLDFYLSIPNNIIVLSIDVSPATRASVVYKKSSLILLMFHPLRGFLLRIKNIVYSIDVSPASRVFIPFEYYRFIY